jgi:undecaprenyl-diphosphatase
VGQALSENPDVKDLMDRYPRFFSFLGRRLDRESFAGLPATLVGIAFIFLLFQFLGVVESLLTSDPIVAADLRTANLLATMRTPGLDRFFLFVTLLGKWPVVLVYGITISGILTLWRRWVFLPGLWVGLIGASASTWLGKVVFHRQRPAVAEYVEWSYSFPSGHAVISVVLYGFLVYLAWRFSKGWRLRVAALAAGAVVILAIGISRLYLGVHYLSDVWGGYLLGLMWLIVGISLSEAAVSGKTLATPAPKEALARAASWTMAAAALGIYLLLGSVYKPPAKTMLRPPLAVARQNVTSVFRENRLPLYTETLTGKDQEPLSFVIAANGDQDLVRIFKQAGWTLAARESVGELLRAGSAALKDKPDPVAPMTPSFWNGSPHDFGFEKPLKHATVRERHHARFWKTDLKTPKGLLLYVGTASLDVGLKWGITHKIQANIDAEREFLFNDLAATGYLKSYGKADFVEPLLGHNFFGDPFFTDGKIYFLNITERTAEESG